MTTTPRYGITADEARLLAGAWKLLDMIGDRNRAAAFNDDNPGQVIRAASSVKTHCEAVRHLLVDALIDAEIGCRSPFVSTVVLAAATVDDLQLEVRS